LVSSKPISPTGFLTRRSAARSRSFWKIISKAKSMKPQRNDMTESYNFHPSILREYDIRGTTGKNLSEEDARALGRAFGTYVKRKGGAKVCSGYDGRHSSPALAAALNEGLASCGLAVTDIGRGPSPMLYFAVKDRMEDAGIMVTGSHNPPADNGFKMMLQGGPVYGEMIKEIGAVAARGDFESGEGTIHSIDIRDHYVQRLLKDYEGGR